MFKPLPVHCAGTSGLFRAKVVMVVMPHEELKVEIKVDIALMPVDVSLELTRTVETSSRQGLSFVVGVWYTFIRNAGVARVMISSHRRADIGC